MQALIAILFFLQPQIVHAADVNPAETCISDICGPPAQAKLFSKVYLDALANYLSSIQKNPYGTGFSPKITQLFKNLMDEQLRQNSGVIAQLKKSQSLGDAPFDKINKAFYNLVIASPLMSKIKYKTPTNNSNISIDEAASATELKDLSQEDRKWLYQTANYIYGLNNIDQVSDSMVNSQPMELVLKESYPGSTIQNALKEEMSQAQAAVASLKNASPLTRTFMFANTPSDRLELIEKHIADGTVNENESREIVQWNRNFKFLTRVTGDTTNPLLTKNVPSVEETISKQGGFAALTEEFAQGLAKDYKKNLDQILACKQVYYLNKKLLPNQDQINLLKKDIRRAKQMVGKMVKEKIPPAMQSKLLEAVESSEFILPPTAAEFEKNFEDNIRNQAEAMKANSNSIEKLSPQDLRMLLPVFAKSFGQDDSGSSDNDYCQSFQYSPMSDANYTLYGKIELSFSTATGDESTRLFTIMHELGHSVSNAISKNPDYEAQFASVRNCLSNEHTEPLPPQTKEQWKDPKSTPYQEEDFADTVSSSSLAGLKAKNPWCGYFMLSNDQQSYVDSSLQADDLDPHSGGVFRLLNIEVMTKGHVPESCSSFMETQNFTDHFRNCLELIDPQGTANAPASTTK